MNVDLESRLREDFGAVPLDVDIDVDAVLAAGRRERARRSGGVIVTFAVVIAAVLVAVPFMRGPGRPAVPEPIQTATRATAVFDNPIQNGSDVPGVARLTMDVEKVGGSGGSLDVSVNGTSVSGKHLAGSFTRPADKPWEPYRVNDYVYVAVLPSAEWFTFVSSGGGWGSDQRQLGDLGLTAVLMVADEPPASIEGVIWRSPDGRVYDSLGNEVSEAPFTPGINVYADPALDVVGLEHDGQGAARKLSEMGDDYRALLSVAAVDQGHSMSWSVFVLPAGARLGQASVKPGFVSYTSETPFVGGALDGRHVVIVRVAISDALDLTQAGTLVESLTFTDATGAVQTVRPGR